MPEQNNAKYDWGRWFLASEFDLVKDRDYGCTTSSMAQQVRNAAVRHDVGVSVHEEDWGLRVYVSPRRRRARR